MALDVLALALSVVFGIFTRLFFKMIHFQTTDERNGPVHVDSTPSEYDLYPRMHNAYDPINYLSASEFMALGSSTPNLVRWAKYFLFRIIPPTIITILLAGVLQRYFPYVDIAIYLLISTIVFLLLTDVHAWLKTRLLSYRILYLCNIFITLAITSLVYISSKTISYGMVAPDINDLFTNIWATLVVAVMVVFYIQTVNFNPVDNKHIELQKQHNALTNFVLRTYNSIDKDYGTVIDDCSSRDNSAKALLLSILIYESLNRPRLIRSIENLVVRIFHIPLTIGIAQVRSREPLSDENSIRLASKSLKDTQNNFWDKYNYPFVDLQAQLKAYNKGRDYPESIYQIMSILSSYLPELFEQHEGGK